MRRSASRLLRLESCERRELLAAISGVVMEDLTGDGLTPDDVPWTTPPKTIELYLDDGDGDFDENLDTLLDTTTTDPVTGEYGFDNLGDGRYFLRELVPAGAARTAGPDVYTFDVINDTVLSPGHIFIDDFVNSPDPVQSYFINAFDLNPTLLKADGPAVLGTERDLFVDVLGADFATSAAGVIGGGSYEFASAMPGTSATLQYDGFDTDVVGPPAALINARSLSSTDLTGGGNSTGLSIEFLSLQVGGVIDELDVGVFLTDTDGDVATFLDMVPESDLTPFSYFIPFSSFTTAPGFTFTSVDSVEVIFNSLGIPDVDFEVDAIIARNPDAPTFANWWLPSKRAFIWPWGSWIGGDGDGDTIDPASTTGVFYGTEGDDLFEFNATDGTVRLNGEDLPYDPQDGLVHFEGLAGNDTVILIGTDGQDTVVLGADFGQVVGDGYSASATEVEQITIDTLGGHDTADVYDSSGDDFVWTWPTGIGMTGTGFSHIARGIQTIYAYASDGHDVGKMYDSSGDDLYVTAPAYAQLSGDGFLSQMGGFDAVHAFASAGGHDVAKFYDSPSDDKFYATPLEAAMYNGGFFYRAKYFDAVHAFATAGGHDRAWLFDSAGDDTFYASPVEAAMYNTWFFNRAKFFEEVEADASAGGDDQAWLFGSGDDDHLEAAGSWARLSFGAKAATVSNFDWIKAVAGADGDNTKHVEAVDFTLLTDGAWTDV